MYLYHGPHIKKDEKMDNCLFMDLVKLFIGYIEDSVVRRQLLIFHELGKPIISVGEASG